MLHGRDGGDYWTRRLHMCTRGTASVAGGFQTSGSNSYFKDGRKIKVGDCALFEPPQDSLPFIGIIRCLVTGKESSLKFSVNWLYRASELELEKGIQLEAAPNEIFYSFHEDEVPAASLLHPCKVAFLPKGVELPSGISSFICRRVYDINQRCLWWLTDQNYIDKRQEEVDHLLSKTRCEMHATVQPGGRSPKSVNDPAPASQVKAGPDVALNVSSFSSHSKGKKRDRQDQDFEPAKRLQKTDDGESHQIKSESILKAEIGRITDRGGLVDVASVEKLVQLMQPGKADQKIDLAGRLILAGVIAATDKFECLNGFVQLKGLPVFDEWLQEIHKGKMGDGNNHKDGDKSVEEFLLVLLRALDKLPVNLRALQMCNIGKSVNHLRSHKNLEIQRKSRGLVDTWKKRVEVEMNMDDRKPGSNMGVAWHGRRTSEPSPNGHRNSGSTETPLKGSSTHLSATKMGIPKVAQGETASTAISTSPGYSKSVLSPAPGGASSKDAQSKTAAVGESPDHLLSTVKDEKSSSSSQSHSQSSSSEHIKTTDSSSKEDPRSSTAGSIGASDTGKRASRSRKLASGLLGPVSRGVHRDIASNRSLSLHKSITPEKSSQSGHINEKMHDLPVADGNTPKLIVKIPNRGRSPAVSANGGSTNEPFPQNGRATSPACPDKPEKLDCSLKEKGNANRFNDTSDVTTKSWHSSDLKDALTGSDEADGTSAVNPDEVRSTNRDQTRKSIELSKVSSSSSGLETKTWKTHEASFSPMNALVESCVKHSEVNALISAVDDVGMNLLATVAAGEMSKSDSAATTSPSNTPVAEDSCAGNSGRSCNVDDSTQEAKDRVKQEIVKQEGSITLESKARDEIPSLDEKVSTGQPVSTSQNTNNQVKKTEEDLKELTSNNKDGSLKGSHEVAADTVPVKGEVSEEPMKDVLKENSMHQYGGSNGAYENSAHESASSRAHIDSGCQPSSCSDAIRGINKISHSSGPGTCTESGIAVGVEAEKLIERKIVKDHDDNSQSSTDHIGRKDQTAEPPVIVGDINLITADYSRNYKEKRPQSNEVLGHCNGVSDLNKASGTKTEERISTDAKLVMNMDTKLGFDLNEGFTTDESKYEEQRCICRTSYPAATHVISPIPFPVSAVSNGLPASVTVAAAAKGPFVPPEDLLLRTGGQLGWKGSAATSAFRPAERKNIEAQVNTSTPSADVPSKPNRPFLDIDLNVPDDSMQDEIMSHSTMSGPSRNENVMPVRAFGGLDLDLNQVDEAPDVGPYAASINRRPEVSSQSSKPGSLPNGEGRRNFDLNNGPLLEEVSTEASAASQNLWGNMPTQPPVASLQMNNADICKFTPWFPQGSAIPAITIPSVLPDRGEQGFSIASSGASQRIYYTPPGSSPFAPDVYRGPVLSSSHALSFPSVPYQYPVFPFGPSYPVPSATLAASATYMDSTTTGRHTIPAGHSQFLGHAGVVSSNYPQPYLVSIPDGRTNGGLGNSNRWGSHGLDLNSGPGNIEVEGRNETSPFAMRQFSVASSQAFTEEQARMFQASGVVLKRKEPEGSWDAEKPKQPSWH